MLLRVMRVVFVTMGTSSMALAQAASPPADPASYGSVVGHVSLPESNLPARFANVALQPVSMLPMQASGKGDEAKMPVTVVQTGLDGGYRLEHVSPGSYYVVVKLPGYLSPIAQFTMDQLKSPTPEMQQKILATVPTVDVRPNGVATADIRLTRGASVSGVVRFDDGAPDPAAKLTLMKRDNKGRWQDVQSARSLHVDSDGRYLADGLDAGEYTLHLTLELQEQKVSAVLGWVTNSSSTTKYSLDFYSGDTVVREEAKVLVLNDGQALSGADLTIPASKLHGLSGAVIDARTGQALNAGRVYLMNAKGAGVVGASIDAEARTFTFAYAPEGEYTLKITDAREVEMESASADPGAGSRARPQEKILRRYASAELPVVLQGDVMGVVLAVKEKAEAPQAASR
jgi:hypothetical protein